MAKKDLTSMRSALDWLKSEGELIEVDNEVDIIYEIAGIQAALEGGPALRFNNLKGFPGTRDVGNVFAREKNVAKMFGVDEHRQLKFKCLDAIKHPLKPRVITEAPCQEVVITGSDIDVLNTIPITKYHPMDAGRVLPSGNYLLSGKYTDGGTHIAFTRATFRGKDWGAVLPSVGSTTEEILLKFRGEKVPCTINICTPPAVLMVASAAFVHTIVPRESDKLGFAGALQGAPVDIVKAKTVDAYAVANSEWVIEGYINAKERVWESEEAEKVGRSGEVAHFQEWTGYVGTSWKAMKFEVTAITHRKDKPTFFTPFSRSIDGDNMCTPFREACFFELAERIAPGLVTDVNILTGMAGWGASIIFQVNKRIPRYEGYQRTVLAAAIACSFTLKMAIAVDEDVDIYSAEDILWAMTTRCNPATGIITGAGGKVLSMMPLEKSMGMGDDVRISGQRIEGCIGVDATLPMVSKKAFPRTWYPVDMVDLKKWFTDKQLADIRASQTGYTALWAKRGG